MHALIETNRDVLADICRRFHVARLEVFGSAAAGDFDESRSDIDFLVEFGDVPDRERFDTYFALLHALEDLFGRRVDVRDAERVGQSSRRLSYRAATRTSAQAEACGSASSAGSTRAGCSFVPVHEQGGLDDAEKCRCGVPIAHLPHGHGGW